MIRLQRTVVHFTLNGIPYARKQFPLQNAFALTVHKTQSLSLDRISVSLDATMFSAGQAYTALSRARRWENVDIVDLTWEAFIVDREALREYERLEQMVQGN